MRRAYTSWMDESPTEMLEKTETLCSDGNYARACGMLQAWLRSLSALVVVERECMDCGVLTGVELWQGAEAEPHVKDGVLQETSAICDACEDKRRE